MADVERDSKISDQIKQTDTPEKDNENRGCKNVCKINSRKRKRSSTSTSSISSFLLLAQAARRTVRVKRKENPGKRHEAFQGRVKKVINQRKWMKISNLRKTLPF